MEIPVGFCYCGCGQKTNACSKTDPLRGLIKGAPRKYIAGHSQRSFRPPSRTCIVDGETCRTLPLSRGKEAIVNEEDFLKVSQHLWYARFTHGTWYASTMIDGKHINLHSFIAPPTDGKLIDHRNGDGLDNRHRNLREATLSQNQQNRLTLIHNKSSQYRGVCWDRRLQKWRADLMFQQVNRYLGAYVIEEEAAKAYDEAARRYFGEFARLNFPNEGEAAALSSRARARDPRRAHT